MYTSHLPNWELTISTWDLQWNPEVTAQFASELGKVIREKKFDESERDRRVTDCDIDLHTMLMKHGNVQDVVYLKAHIEGRGDWRFVVAFLKMTWQALKITQAPKITLRNIKYEEDDGDLITDCGEVDTVDIFGEENKKIED